MTASIHRLGHDTFRIDGTTTIYIDPWKLPRTVVPAQLVLVTHDHFDHLNLDDIGRISTPDTVVVGPAAVTTQIGDRFRTITVAPGDSVEVGTASVAAVPAYNLNKFRAPGQLFHPPEAGYVGYVITLDGTRIYHAGDTDAIDEMRGIDCDVAILPVSGTYVMTADEAVQACGMLHAREVIPMHYADIVGTDADAEYLAGACPIPVTVLPLERD
jgi:L-ascorbate metabolism protein UlaG (beta-lactamase superfamily)